MVFLMAFKWQVCTEDASRGWGHGPSNRKVDAGTHAGLLRLRGGKAGGLKARDMWDKVCC